MYKINDQVIQLDVPFTVGEGDEAIQYPANWIRLATQEDKDAIGLVEVVQQSRPDDRFYFISDNGDGTFTSIPRDLDELKKGLIANLKRDARNNLSHTDWYIQRQSDPSSGEEIPQEVLEERSAIRSAVSQKETAINKVKTIEQLIQLF